MVLCVQSTDFVTMIVVVKLVLNMFVLVEFTAMVVTVLQSIARLNLHSAGERTKHNQGKSFVKHDEFFLILKVVLTKICLLLNQNFTVTVGEEKN